MGRKQLVKAILFLFGFVPFLVTGQNYPRFELYQLKQGTDSGQFIVTGLDSNLAFNNILRFRSADSTFLIGTDTVITDQSIIPILLRTIDAGLGIDVNQVDNQIFIESLSIEDSIYNGTASTISKGTPLYAVGVQGNYWSVAPADASDPNKMPVVVIAGEDIASGATGLGLIKGHIKQVNTTGLADGAEVYVASGGGYTSTKPTAEGVIIQRLGTVIKGNSANGSGIINLGDEAYWNDYTSLIKLRDTLVILRDSVTNQIRDSLVFYVSRVELNDTLVNYVDRVELNDTLINYVDRVELIDSLLLYPNRVELGDSLVLYVSRVELIDSLLLYPNRVELGDTASAIRADIPSLSGVVLTTTDQSISGVKSFQDDVSIDGALDIAYRGNTYLGNYAGYGIRQDLTTARNVIIGTEAYFTENYANDNVVIGYFAGRNTEYGSNVIIGSNANYFTSPSYVIASNAVVIGKSAKTTTTQSDNSIVIGANATGLGDDTAVIGDGQMTKLNSNKYTFNVDQDTTGKNGYLLGLNSSSGEIELQDISGSYINRTELSDTAFAIRTDIPLIINDSLTARNFLTEEVDGSVTNELQTISTSGASGNITLSNGGGTLNLNVNDADASTTNEIQNISTSGAAGNISISSGSTLNLNVNDADASVTNEGSLTVGAGTSTTSLINSNTSGSTPVTLTAGTNITLSETGNNITIAASGGGSSLWSEGATTGEIYYNSGNVGIGLTDPNFPLHVSGDIYSSDDIFVDDELVFGNVADGSVPYIDNLANYMYLSVNASSGTLFNFRDRYASTNPFTINANNATTILDFNGTSDFAGAMNIEGNLTQSGSIVQDVGSVTFNNTQGNYDFNVYSDNCCTTTPFMWVDASADKVQIGTGTPQYTLDVTGDINFTGDLYDDGSLVSFTGTTINNNADNRIITGSSTANTLNAESGLTWDGTTLNADGIVRIAYNSASGGGYYLRNTSTGLTSGNGIAMSLDLTDFYLTNYENADIILTTNNNANQRLILKNDGTVQFTAYGSGTLSTDASGNISASDGRFKTVTRTMESGLDKVMKLKPLYYRWNEDSGFNTEFEEAGFIAQDVKKVIPEAVPNEEEENRKLNYSDRAIIATLTKAIQEQQEMIAELQKEIKRIKRKIK